MNLSVSPGMQLVVERGLPPVSERRRGAGVVRFRPLRTRERCKGAEVMR